MSSEAITQNDLREILSRTVGSVPSEYRKLLWTNPNPTSSFPAQTVPLDLSNYDEVEIEAKQLASGTIIQLCRVGLGKQTKCLFRDGNANNFYTRTFVVSASSIQFGDAYYNSTVTNTDCVPIAIYGIKFERVAPPQVDASDYVVEQGANYRKWDSGRLEQWGLETSASSANHPVSFPTPFISNDYVVVGSNTSGTQANFMVSSINASYFYVYPSASTKLYWIAYGRWK